MAQVQTQVAPGTVNLIIVQSPRALPTAISKAAAANNNNNTTTKNNNSVKKPLRQKPILPNSVAKTTHKATPPLKPAKKLRDEETEILRCKRRLDFAKLGLNLQRPNPGTVARRNERERNRVKLINNTFAALRERIPFTVEGTDSSGGKNKKLSKVDTLRGAIEYIRLMQQLLSEHDTMVSAAAAAMPNMYSQYHPQVMPTMPASLGAMPTSMGMELPPAACYPDMMHHQLAQNNLLQPHHPHQPEQISVSTSLPVTVSTSHDYSTTSHHLHQNSHHVPISSPTNSCGSDTPSSPPLSPEEEEILDFASWFQ